MSGRLVLSTPWSKQYLPSDLRPTIAALVPDGHALVVGARVKPGEWTLDLYRDPTPEEVAARKAGPRLARVQVRGRDLPHLCAWFLSRYSPEAA